MSKEKAFTPEEQRAVFDALNLRDMWINPQSFSDAADAIDCGPWCSYISHEVDTNAAFCNRAEYGKTCRNDVAETLRALGTCAARARGASQ